MTIPASQLPLTSLSPIEVDEADDADPKLVSVTTILNCLDKPALVYWAADETAQCAVNDMAVIQAFLDNGNRDDAIEYLTKARNRSNKGQMSATALGTEVHSVAETLAAGEEPDFEDMHPQVAQLSRNLVDWWEYIQPKPIASELTVYSPSLGYAGSLDLIAEVDGVRCILDFKTTKENYYKSGKERKPYPEQVGLQLAAYKYADFAATWHARRYEKGWGKRYYLLSEEEQAQSIPVPEVDAALVIHITPGWCRAYPICVDEDAFEYFKNTIEVFRWLDQHSKRIMPLKPLPDQTKELAALIKESTSPRALKPSKKVTPPKTNAKTGDQK